MLSHDNVTWSTRMSTEDYNWKNETAVSYLPMSHLAPHIMDGYMIPSCGGTIFIADKDALKGTLVRKKYISYCKQIKNFTCSEVDM